MSGIMFIVIKPPLRKESLNSGQQFHQYQRNEQSPLILTNWAALVVIIW